MHVELVDAERAREGKDRVTDAAAHEHHAPPSGAHAMNGVTRARRERALVLGCERGEVVARGTHDAEALAVDRVEREVAVHRPVGEVGDPHAGRGTAARGEPVDALDAAERGIDVEHDAGEAGVATGPAKQHID